MAAQKRPQPLVDGKLLLAKVFRSEVVHVSVNAYILQHKDALSGRHRTRHASRISITHQFTADPVPTNRLNDAEVDMSVLEPF